MRREGNRIIFERKNCQCGDGTVPGQVRCKKCNGSGKGVRGGRGGCRSCNGYGHTWDSKNPVTCTRCNGNYKNAEPEDETDYLPADIWLGLEFKVFRHDRSMSFNESYLGGGCVFSCSDYGRAWAKDDATVIAEVKSDTSHQACKVCKDGTLCNYVGIFVSPGGYSVRAVYDSSTVTAVLGELPEKAVTTRTTLDEIL